LRIFSNVKQKLISLYIVPDAWYHGMARRVHRTWRNPELHGSALKWYRTVAATVRTGIKFANERYVVYNRLTGWTVTITRRIIGVHCRWWLQARLWPLRITSLWPQKFFICQSGNVFLCEIYIVKEKFQNWMKIWID